MGSGCNPRDNPWTLTVRRGAGWPEARGGEDCGNGWRPGRLEKQPYLGRRGREGLRMSEACWCCASLSMCMMWRFVLNLYTHSFIFSRFVTEIMQQYCATRKVIVCVWVRVHVFPCAVSQYLKVWMTHLWYPVLFWPQFSYIIHCFAFQLPAHFLYNTASDTRSCTEFTVSIAHKPL